VHGGDGNLSLYREPKYFPAFDVRAAAHRQPMRIDLIRFFSQTRNTFLFSSTLETLRASEGLVLDGETYRKLALHCLRGRGQGT
jgi:hypothetical protein